jgi:hypothetical protein
MEKMPNAATRRSKSAGRHIPRNPFALTIAITAIALFAACGDPTINTPTDGTQLSTGKPNTLWYQRDAAASEYTIRNADELAGLAQLADGGNTFNRKTVTLANDIDISIYGKSYNDGKGWIPIKDFCGTFDGNGKTVSGLYIFDTTNEMGANLYYAGLFGRVIGGTVKDLKLTGVELINCDGNHVGGVVGFVIGGGVVANCSVDGAIRGGYHIGGVVGSVDGGSVICCSFSSTVSDSTSYPWASRVVGYEYNGSVSDCAAVELLEHLR